MYEIDSDVEDLSRIGVYLLANEAYRMMPPLLKERYGIEITDKLIRTFIEGEEIDILGKGKRNGQNVLLVGEIRLRLDECCQEEDSYPDIFDQLTNKVRAVRKAYPDVEIVPLLVAHFAQPDILRRAEDRGIIVVQSFAWQRVGSLR